MRSNVQRRLRVGILDLDVFGPSVPTLMGLLRAEGPRLTPCTCISMVLDYATYCISWCYHPNYQPWTPNNVNGLPPSSSTHLFAGLGQQRHPCCLAWAHGAESRPAAAL